MYLAVETKQTCAAAWLEAALSVSAVAKRQAYNVIIDVAEPLAQTHADGAVVELVDSFLREKGKQPVQTVANTIFPEALYRVHGAPDFINKFHTDILPKIRKKDRWSGYYFDRMTAYHGPDGMRQDLLWNIVERIRDEKNKSLNKYELALFDPHRDIDNSPYGGQCLSFLSFKLAPGSAKTLLLTAMYRNHYYIEKLLGNLIGLARLMSFIANEAAVQVGSLTVLSTHAVIDVPKGVRRRDINKLLSNCRAVLETTEAA